MQSGCKMQTMPSFFKTSTCRVLYELHLTSYVIPFVRFYMMTTASRELLLLLVQWEFWLSHFLREISWAFKKGFLQAICHVSLCSGMVLTLEIWCNFYGFACFPSSELKHWFFSFIYLKDFARHRTIKVKPYQVAVILYKSVSTDQGSWVNKTSPSTFCFSLKKTLWMQNVPMFQHAVLFNSF
jgi:hypothetical protein